MSKKLPAEGERYPEKSSHGTPVEDEVNQGAILLPKARGFFIFAVLRDG